MTNTFCYFLLVLFAVGLITCDDSDDERARPITTPLTGVGREAVVEDSTEPAVDFQQRKWQSGNYLHPMMLL